MNTFSRRHFLHLTGLGLVALQTGAIAAEPEWQSLFDGKTLTGWNNFKKKDIKPGWQVKDGNLVCVDPKNASDLCTADQYGWFELSIDYNINKAGNSGIIFHVTEEGGAVWATGPELQLQDNANAKDPQLCGWLYQLYKPEIDPKTGKPLDATKPFGEWNTIKLIQIGRAHV